MSSALTCKWVCVLVVAELAVECIEQLRAANQEHAFHNWPPCYKWILCWETETNKQPRKCHVLFYIAALFCLITQPFFFVTGLTLKLYLQTDEFVDGLTNGYGVKVVVHDRGTKPLPDDEGVFVPSASETNIALRQVNTDLSTTLTFQCCIFFSDK